MQEVLVNRLGGLSLPRKNVVRLTDHPELTIAIYHGHKVTKLQRQNRPANLTESSYDASVGSRDEMQTKWLQPNNLDDPYLQKS